MGDRMAHREQAMQSNGCDEPRARWDRSPRLASSGVKTAGRPTKFIVMYNWRSEAR